VFAGKKSAQIREILISESAWEEMTCLFAPSQAGDRSKDKNLSLINGDNERTIVDHAPFVGSIVPVAVRFFQANIEEG
ncbi:hypothetical protein, partial [Klebsiella pneumoniae]|uniref:hypothetical protein n=1 Tax=Klebsiella pneumoniae TaxID=573 RepID=UPI0038D24D9B